MSVLYCGFCDRHIDTDYDCEHYNSDGKCYEEWIYEMKEEGLTEDEIEEKLEKED